MNKSEQINELASALAKAQLELSNPKKNSVNPFFNKKYADLSEVINVSKHTLAELGLSIIQLLDHDQGHVEIETILTHESGQYISGKLSIPVSKPDAQGIGSAATYGRRYAWAAICGLAQEDDDANSATMEPAEPRKKEVTPENKELWERAKAAFKRDGNLDAVTKNAIISEENIIKIYEECDSV